MTMIFIIAFLAAMVTGALGYGFSSIASPIGLIYFSNRILNPVLVLVEFVINAYSLVLNRHYLPRVWRRLLPLAIGVFPMVIVGSLIVSEMNENWIKLVTYCVLAPLVLLHGLALAAKSPVKTFFSFMQGCGLGLLYGATTISGPPLALILERHGFTKNSENAKEEFRSSMALLRLLESAVAVTAYQGLGLISSSTLADFWIAIPAIALGVPLGARVFRQVPNDLFRRISISVSVLLVGFGLGHVLIQTFRVSSWIAYVVLAFMLIFDSISVIRFLKQRRPQASETLEIKKIDNRKSA